MLFCLNTRKTTLPSGDAVHTENGSFKGTKDENLGFYSELFSAKSDVNGQDGGIVTAVLLSGLQKGVFDAAVVVNCAEGYCAKVVVAKSSAEVMATRGTVYLQVNPIPKLSELMGTGKKKIAIVCTPCQAQAARKIQQNLKREGSDVEITIIGLFCLEAFHKDKLKEEIHRLTGVDIDKVEKTKIHKGKFILPSQGKEYSCKVKDLHKAVEKACLRCSDFSAALADISVGSVGSPDGYSTVMVRSEAGKKLIENLDILKAETKKEEIIKLSKFKMERAEDERASL